MLIYNNFQATTEKSYIKDYGSFQEIYVLKSVLKEGFEPLNEKHTSNIEKNRISTSRIKSKIRDYAMMNNFTHFYTQTISSVYDRYDLQEFKKMMLSKLKAYKRKNKDFIYLIIFEKHKDGAFHLHGLVGGLGVDVHANSNGYDTLGFFEDIGFNSISIIKDKMKVSNYILKYISKDIVKTSSGVSYFHSKDLRLPEVLETFIDDFNSLECTFENDFIKKFVLRGEKNV